jgi:hypothetical protein
LIQDPDPDAPKKSESVLNESGSITLTRAKGKGNYERYASQHWLCRRNTSPRLRRVLLTRQRAD